MKGWRIKIVKKIKKLLSLPRVPMSLQWILICQSLSNIVAHSIDLLIDTMYLYWQYYFCSHSSKAYNCPIDQLTSILKNLIIKKKYHFLVSENPFKHWLSSEIQFISIETQFWILQALKSYFEIHWMSVMLRIKIKTMGK